MFAKNTEVYRVLGIYDNTDIRNRQLPVLAHVACIWVNEKRQRNCRQPRTAANYLTVQSYLFSSYHTKEAATATPFNRTRWGRERIVVVTSEVACSTDLASSSSRLHQRCPFLRLRTRVRFQTSKISFLFPPSFPTFLCTSVFINQRTHIHGGAKSKPVSYLSEGLWNGVAKHLFKLRVHVRWYSTLARGICSLVMQTMKWWTH